MKSSKPLLLQPVFALLLLFFLLSLPLVYALLSSTPAAATGFDERVYATESAADAAGLNCRYGVASWANKDLPFLQQLKPGWVGNFTVNFNQSLPAGVEYVPTIRLQQARDANGHRLPNYVATPPLTDSPGGLGARVTANPGALWLVGNEVDRIFWQDDIMPDIYARAYHEIYHFIKARDATAQVAISGLVEVTPGRLQYLDIVWDSYVKRYGKPMTVDVWNMHVYILPEKRADGSGSNAAIALGTDPALAILESGNNPALCPLANVYCYAEHDNMSIFAQQVVAMRQWMKERGQQNKPLILSEFSLLYPFTDYDDPVNPSTCFLMDEFGGCFTPQRVSQFMINSFNYLETAADPNLGYPLDNNRLVQQWLWFAMNDGSEGTPNKLVNDNYTALTQMGSTYRDQVAARPLTLNLRPGYVTSPVVIGATSATISASVRNNGNTATAAPFVVTFYSNAALTNAIGSVTVPAGLGGCARQEHVVSVTWSGLSSGLNRYWVKIDRDNTIGESNENDNVTSGFVLVNPRQLHMPVIRR